MDKQINHDNHHDESKTRNHIFSKLPDDGNPWAPNNFMKPGAKEKHQLNPGGPSNRQEAPVPNHLMPDPTACATLNVFTAGVAV